MHGTLQKTSDPFQIDVSFFVLIDPSYGAEHTGMKEMRTAWKSYMQARIVPQIRSLFAASNNWLLISAHWTFSKGDAEQFLETLPYEQIVAFDGPEHDQLMRAASKYAACMEQLWNGESPPTVTLETTTWQSSQVFAFYSMLPSIIGMFSTTCRYFHAGP